MSWKPLFPGDPGGRATPGLCILQGGVRPGGNGQGLRGQRSPAATGYLGHRLPSMWAPLARVGFIRTVK